MILKTVLTVVALVLAGSLAFGQPSKFPLPANFDGAKFAARYGLSSEDFWADEFSLFVKEGITLPDEPPIFDPPDVKTKRQILKEKLSALRGSTGARPELKEFLDALKEALGL